ncbi:MAG: stage II sporulation protein M, partial [Planctomycetota bacterium]
MLPHSFTLLLEGQAYILATFFALLIPVYLFRKSEGPKVLHRYGRALMINLRGYLIVLSILIIAAIYESVE